MQEMGEEKRLKGKIQNLSPFPLNLLPTSARSLILSVFVQRSVTK
ncbi:hypothetical protein FDUTEX481_03698 [Tolypothrix sp. PCC 7601]|nr:hypothetical protein FDUTEX481_03698 [Tolypothrix sp. PCC 7601]